MNALNWAKFFALVLGDLSELGRELFARHGGDVDAAKAELKEIRDHGGRRREAERKLDAELAEDAKRRAAAGAFGKDKP